MRSAELQPALLRDSHKPERRLKLGATKMHQCIFKGGRSFWSAAARRRFSPRDMSRVSVVVLPRGVPPKAASCRRTPKRPSINFLVVCPFETRAFGRDVSPKRPRTPRRGVPTPNGYTTNFLVKLTVTGQSSFAVRLTFSIFYSSHARLFFFRPPALCSFAGRFCRHLSVVRQFTCAGAIGQSLCGGY
jgi:hypothetical protein